MRILNNKEVEQVSGGGILSDLTAFNAPLNGVAGFFVTVYNVGVFLTGSRAKYITLGPDGSPF